MKINVKKFILALVVSFLLIVIFDILLHAILLREVWNQSKSYWLPPEQMNRLVPVAWLLLLVTLVFYGLIYLQWSNKGVKRGLQLGLLLGLGTGSGALGLSTVVPWPMAIVAGMAVQQLVNNLVFGYVFGRFYKD